MEACQDWLRPTGDTANQEKTCETCGNADCPEKAPFRIVAFDRKWLIRNTGTLSDMIGLWKQLDEVDAVCDAQDGLRMAEVDDEYFRDRLVGDSGYLAFATDDDSLIGMVSNTLSKDHENGYYCCRLVVDKDHRRKGVGEALMRRVLHANRDKGARTFLGCSAHNEEALALYRKLGFRTTAYTLVDPEADA